MKNSVLLEKNKCQQLIKREQIKGVHNDIEKETLNQKIYSMGVQIGSLQKHLVAEKHKRTRNYHSFFCFSLVFENLYHMPAGLYFFFGIFFRNKNRN